ncbi:MAG: tetratricopeptide repeat protein, partial [Chitinophagaceae bacterium]|nr:tetratricopeptide repeat protein [Chitinophagaceae bacterium]
MRKRIIIPAIATLFSLNAFSQNKYVDSLINWVTAHPNIDSQHIVTLHRISYRLSEKDIKRSFAYFEKVAALSDSLNFIYGKALAQINLGILLSNSANYEASNNAYFKAIDFAEACGSPRLKAVSLNNAGDNFKTLKDFEKCRQYTKEAISINEQLEAWRGVAINYELLYECDLEEKLYQDAKTNLLTGMPFALKDRESYILSQYYLGFGKLQAINNHPDSAVYYFTNALEQAKLQSDLRNEYEVYLAQSEFLKNTKPGLKFILLDSALSIAKRTGYLKGISEASQQLSSVYDQTGNKDSSLFYYRSYRSASDSMFSDNNKRNVIIKEAEWMIRRKEIENRHLKELSLLQNRQIAIKNGLLLAVIISLLLTIAIAFFINRSIQLKKKRKEAAFKQKIAETQMQVLRAQMNPHFIFNSLSSIENFIMKNDKIQASDYLNKFALLIRMILDSSRSELVSFAKDIEALQLYIELEQLRFNNKFLYESSIDPALLNNDYTVPPLLIQPYVENAILHGLAPVDHNGLVLKITAKLDEDYIVYTIADNGIGRQKSASYKQQNKPLHASMGMQITEQRISIFNEQQNTNGEVSVTDLYDN